MLALAYTPAYLTLRSAGHRLLNRLQRAQGHGPTTWADWYADRKALEELMELSVATSREMRTGLAITAPLAGSVIGLLLGTSA